jgi:hypothetical protein
VLRGPVDHQHLAAAVAAVPRQPPYRLDATRTRTPRSGPHHRCEQARPRRLSREQAAIGPPADRTCSRRHFRPCSLGIPKSTILTEPRHLDPDLGTNLHYSASSLLADDSRTARALSSPTPDDPRPPVELPALFHLRIQPAHASLWNRSRLSYSCS